MIDLLALSNILHFSYLYSMHNRGNGSFMNCLFWNSNIYKYYWSAIRIRIIRIYKFSLAGVTPNGNGDYYRLAVNPLSVTFYFPIKAGRYMSYNVIVFVQRAG